MHGLVNFLSSPGENGVGLRSCSVAVYGTNGSLVTELRARTISTSLKSKKVLTYSNSSIFK